MAFKAVVPVVLAVSCLLWVGEVQAAVLWKGDFETGDVSQWSSSIALKTGDRQNLVIEGDNVAEGMKAAKITLQQDIIFEPYNQSRVEVKHVGLHTKNGEDSYFAWSFMVPKDAEIRSNIGYWESTPTSKNTMTFFIEPANGGGTNLKFGTGDLGQTVRWTAKLELNKWHRIAIHNHWSQSDADAKVDVWYDSMQVVTGATATKRDANELFFQMGLHRSDPSPPVQDIYLDAAIEADSQADILMALPGGGGMAGSGGMGGASAGGSASAGAGGVGGTGGDSQAGGSAGVGGAAGAGGLAGGAGGGATAGGATAAGQASGGTAPIIGTPNSATADDSGSCAVRRRNGGGGGEHGGVREAWAVLSVLLLGLRKRRERG
jgi:Polysaccharide lyase